MKSPSLSRRIYNNSLTLTLSFSFYVLIFLYTLSCESEETTIIPAQIPPEEVEVIQQDIAADSVETTTSEAVSYVEEITK